MMVAGLGTTAKIAQNRSFIDDTASKNTAGSRRRKGGGAPGPDPVHGPARLFGSSIRFLVVARVIREATVIGSLSGS
jgi:hypothetical protein